MSDSPNPTAASGAAARQLLGMKGASGTVKGFRTVDGKGIGVVVELAGGQTAWFFDDEVTPA